VVPRHEESEADAAMRAAVADVGLMVSRYQLERWRQLGLLPRARIRRATFGGSRALAHDGEAIDAAVFLASQSRRGRPWQLVGVDMFDRGYPLGENCLRACARYLVDRLQSRLRGYWEEASAIVPLTSDDPDDQAHRIAERAVAIMRERRVNRALIAFIRRDIERLLPAASPGERANALQAALVWRVLDIARPGTLSTEERMLAVTGQESGDVSDVVPLPPSDIARVAETLTLREATALRARLAAAWDTGELEPRPDTTVLEDVLLELTHLRTVQGRDHLARALPLEFVEEINADTRAALSAIDDGLVRGQLALDLGDVDLPVPG
jgi:hypothetical protein